MANKGPAGSQEEYLRAAWVEQKACEDEHLCIIEMSFHPTERKGVFCFHFEAFGPVVDKGLLSPLGRVQTEFPNGSSKDLAGCMMASLIKLSSMVSESRGQEEERTRAS